MEQRRILPIGIQDFENLRERGCIYVDKTDLVYQLASESHPYFLSRPRRFGKSLLISTLDAYFSGRKDLFHGLAIEKLEKDWVEYPVIKINFVSDGYSEKGSLASRLNFMLSKYEELYGITEIDDRFAGRFENIITKAYNQTQKQVVILIDEYDKPILDALYTEIEEQNRSELRDFYSPLKGCDHYIKFIFITGITKVSHVNIFSGLNQLDDISLNEKYSSICGFSETELTKYFMPEIESLAQRQEMTVEETRTMLAKMYDGYHFTHDVEGVYNPFCLLKCFSERDFGSYWFESGTPSFLVKTLQNQPTQLISMLNGRKATEDQFKNYDPDTHNMLPVIYQSGYLTIKDFKEERRTYTLGFPNREVENGFLNVVLRKFVKVPDDDLGLAIDNLCDALEDGNIDKVLSIIKAGIADLPTILKKDQCENYYESVTHIMFRLTGYDVVSELQSVYGRSDIVVNLPNDIYIFELKMDGGKAFDEVADAALKQIDDSGYTQRYSVSGKSLHKVAVVYSSDGAGMVGWKIV